MSKHSVASLPTRKKDRNLFNRFSENEKDATRDRVEELYDGTRTLSRCWILALEEKYRVNQ